MGTSCRRKKSLFNDKLNTFYLRLYDVGTSCRYKAHAHIALYTKHTQTHKAVTHNLCVCVCSWHTRYRLDVYPWD